MNSSLNLAKAIDNVRKTHPLVHNITNYVTVHDVANIILACGGSPIMSDEPEDVEDITSICNALNINIGTLNKQSIDAMFVAGRRAADLNHAMLLDPVGAGASRLRTTTALELVASFKFTAIRGNISEISTLAKGSGTTRGVDADAADAVTNANLTAKADLARAFAAKTGSIIAITGAIDLVADADRCCAIRNGTPRMGTITGTGCQLSGMTAAFLAANMDDPFTATVAAICSMGLAGEIAEKAILPGEGNATFGNRIIDAISLMDADTLEKGAKYELL